ncbi:hypothetical protein GRF29_8g1221725 [Pseudopithomyces chartarum]|uniref:Yeast cell wall synthesis Kre9/Knh1-like N-terminal domain-containing protein n=1 Tax=Pseudopithomyces chartarum TaxID=1892770 RepID=A0AAN6RJR3_9PLEO|nr:hypothetical protein GRF29_8g1221725 [Pseudopithomyces chartarum]
MFTQVSLAAFFAGLAAAYHEPTTKGGNAITAPLLESVPAGKPFTIQWTADSPNPVSLILLKGESGLGQVDSVIVEGIPNTGSYTWTPSTALEGTDGPHGWGIQLIDDVDGHYQYSTQFGIQNAAPVEESSAPVEEPTATATPSAVEPSKDGYPVETPAVSSSAYEVPPVESSTDCTTTTTIYVPPPVGTAPSSGAPPASVIYPTGPVTVPESLKPTGTGYPIQPPSATPSMYDGAASGLQAGVGLVGAVAAFVAML